MQCPGCQQDNPAHAKFCLECGQALSEAAETSSETLNVPHSEGERKLVTVLFSDLAGYTAMTERLDPEEVREIMGRVFGHAAQVIAKYDGTVEKYIGDAVMAVFGVPQVHEDDSVRAVRAARELHQFVENLNPELQHRVGRSMSMHTGINTGLVVTGRVMDVEKGGLGVLGDTVNVASRLSSLAPPGDILVGALTHTLTERVFAFEKLDSVQVKGKAEAIEVYRLMAPLERAATRRFAGLRAELIGRKVEMATLEEAADGLRDREGAVIVLRGKAGTGKSRLVEEFRAVQEEKGITWVEGRAYDYTQAIPYYPLIDLLNRVWRIEEGDAPERVREKVESNVRALLGAESDALPYLGGLYALDYPELEGQAPEYWKRRLFQGALEVFEALAGSGPTIFYIEDLHWADPSFQELLRHILAELRSPAVIVCSYRPPFTLFPEALPNGLEGRYRELELADLTPSQAQDMAVSLLGGGELPGELDAFVAEKAGGNPFYMEEVLTSLVESRALMRENGHWRLAGALADFNVPATIQGVISARLDRLEAPNKRLLQEAAVIGQNFFYEVLNRITETNQEVAMRLNGLEEQDLIRTRALEPDLEYMFKHPLTQEVVYHSLLRSECQAIHERVGQAIEEVLCDRLPEYYERLAHHFQQGQSLYKAVDYLMKSGEKAMNRFALEEAHRYFEEAYKLLEAKEEKSEAETNLLFDLLDKWGKVFYYFGTFRELLALLRKHEPLAERLRDKALRGMFHAWLGASLYFMQRLQESYRTLQQALVLGEQAADKRVIGYARTWLAMTCSALGRFSEGIVYAERAHEIAQTMPEDDYLHFKSLGMTGLNYYLMGEAVQTRKVGQRLVEYGERHGNPRGLLFGHWMIANGHSNAGDFPAAMAASEKAIQVSKDPLYLLVGQAAHGINCTLNGQVDPMFGEAISRFRNQGIEWLVNWLGGFQGVGRIIEGRMGAGMKLIDEASRNSLVNGDSFLHHLNESLKGKVYLNLATGDPPPPAVMLKNLGFLLLHLPFAARRAETLLARAAEFFGEVEAHGLRAQALLDLGLLHKAKKRRAKAKECLAEAEGLFERMGAEVFLRQTRETLAELSP